jgi:hypothetical protein
VKYSFIAQHKKTWPIDSMCRILGIKRNGYYRFQKYRGASSGSLHQEKLECVKEIAVASGYSYGSRRMKEALNSSGYAVSRNGTRE